MGTALGETIKGCYLRGGGSPDQSLATAATYIRDLSNARMLQNQSGRSGLRVQKSASGTAKYTMHCRCLAHALGFGTDNLAECFLPMFWSTEWPEAFERAYFFVIQLQYQQTGRLESEMNSIWSQMFRTQVACGPGVLQDGTLGIGYLHCRTAYFDELVTTHSHFDQLVVLGAGFDTRAYRLLKCPARCFEVDAPTTQAEKLEVRSDRRGGML